MYTGEEIVTKHVQYNVKTYFFSSLDSKWIKCFETGWYNYCLTLLNPKNPSFLGYLHSINCNLPRIWTQTSFLRSSDLQLLNQYLWLPSPGWIPVERKRFGKNPKIPLILEGENRKVLFEETPTTSSQLKRQEPTIVPTSERYHFKQWTTQNKDYNVYLFGYSMRKMKMKRDVGINLSRFFLVVHKKTATKIILPLPF